jgi:hypothetical protein
MVLTALAGYVAAPVLGVGAAWLLAAHHVTATLWLLLALLTGTFLAVRNAYGVLAVLATAVTVCAVTWFTSAAVQAVFGYGVAWFLLFGGVRPVVELQQQRSRRGARSSDADQLAHLTHVGGGAWVALFGLIAIAALVVGARLLIPVPSHLPQHVSFWRRYA